MIAFVVDPVLFAQAATEIVDIRYSRIAQAPAGSRPQASQGTPLAFACTTKYVGALVLRLLMSRSCALMFAVRSICTVVSSDVTKMIGVLVHWLRSHRTFQVFQLNL